MTNQIVQLIGDAIVAVIPIIISIVFVVVGNFIIKSGKSKEIMSDLSLVEDIAKSVVTCVEKSGVANNLTGAEKFDKAVIEVQKVLNDLGINSVDIDTIKKKVEYAYAQEKETIEKAYKTVDTISVSNPK